jgi:hypothetical protein
MMPMIFHSRARSLFYSHALLLPVASLFIAGLFFITWLAHDSSIYAAAAHPAAPVGGCERFPADNIWNYDISNLPVDANSASYIASIGLNGHLHPDFGAGLYDGGPIGFPYAVVPGSQPYVPVSFEYASESDPGPYPIPANVPIEGGVQSSGDRHVLVVDSGTCKLYEMYASYPQSNGSWQAGSGAVWDLNSDALRPATWTSADAAGLPILPGLVSYDDIAAGAITHALRFTVNSTQNTFLWPARHQASSSSNPDLPPMGLRLRLKASVDISSFSRTNQIILTALKHYGMFVADNGSSWFISGTSDSRWNNDDLHALTSIPGSDFEAVDESALQVSANSAQARGAPPVTASPTARPSPTISATPTRSPNLSKTTSPTTLALAPQKNDAPPQENGNGQAISSSEKDSGANSALSLVVMSAIVLLAVAGILLVYLRLKRRAGFHRRT